MPAVPRVDHPAHAGGLGGHSARDGLQTLQLRTEETGYFLGIIVLNVWLDYSKNRAVLITGTLLFVSLASLVCVSVDLG